MFIFGFENNLLTRLEEWQKHKETINFIKSSSKIQGFHEEETEID
jgi:hypothetical protein